MWGTCIDVVPDHLMEIMFLSRMNFVWVACFVIYCPIIFRLVKQTRYSVGNVFCQTWSILQDSDEREQFYIIVSFPFMLWPHVQNSSPWTLEVRHNYISPTFISGVLVCLGVIWSKWRGLFDPWIRKKNCCFQTKKNDHLLELCLFFVLPKEMFTFAENGGNWRDK